MSVIFTKKCARRMRDRPLIAALADCYAALGPSGLPPRVMEKARLTFADFVGTLVVGYREGVLPPIVNAHLRSRPTPQEATWLSLDTRTSAEDAAFSMGVASHAVELDDGHRFGTSHPAVAVIPAAAAVAERERCSFHELMAAVVIGYDAMLRLARAINPSHLRRGFHSTGTCGAFGAAWAAGWLMKLDRDALAHAASIGALQSAGLQEMLHDNPAIKPLQSGKAAANGVLAAELARAGARGPRSVLEGAHGWCRAFTDDFREEELLRGLGSDFEILNTYTKLYPTCRHCHAAIDLALAARREIGPDRVDVVRSIVVHTYDVAISEVGAIFEPRSYDDAMFSLPFAVALALKNGRVTLQDYVESNFRDAILQRIQRCISIYPDPAMNAKYPAERGARMHIEYGDSGVWESFVPLPRGEPELPVTPDELKTKFVHCVQPYYPRDRVESAWHVCVASQESDAYAQLVRALKVG